MKAKYLAALYLFFIFLFLSSGSVLATLPQPGIRLPGGEALPMQVPFTNLGDIISALLPYIFVLAGLILFGFLIFGGFELLTSAGNPDKVKSAQGKITNAIVGFIIIFLSYWIVQILGVIFGISILG